MRHAAPAPRDAINARSNSRGEGCRVKHQRVAIATCRHAGVAAAPKPGAGDAINAPDQRGWLHQS
jgi:hypothetical protein